MYVPAISPCCSVPLKSAVIDPDRAIRLTRRKLIADPLTVPEMASGLRCPVHGNHWPVNFSLFTMISRHIGAALAFPLCAVPFHLPFQAAAASALSMGSGAYLSSKSEREVQEAELRRERTELQQNPEEEQEELALFYQLKGVPESEAKVLEGRLMAQPEAALRALGIEELGLSEQTYPNPWTSAISATLSTAAGAFIPIIPFFFTRGYSAILLSFAISTAAHFVIGAAKTVVTGLSPWRSGA